MNNLDIKFVNHAQSSTVLLIDGEMPVKSKKTRGVNHIYHETEKDSVKVEIVTFSYLSQPFWWLFEALFFIISIFGIFDIRQKNPERVILYEGTLSLSALTTATVRVKKWKKGEPCVVIDNCSTSILEVRNEATVDEDIKKRAKSLVFIKVALVIALAIVGAVIIASLI